jgi:hypothetical protein
MTIDAYDGIVPNRSTQTQSQFSTNTDNLLAYVIETFVPQLNATAVGSTESGTFGSLSVGNGAAGSGGLFFTSDTDTNIYRSALNELSIATGGSQRIAINSTGLDVSGRVSCVAGTATLPSVRGPISSVGTFFPDAGNAVAFSAGSGEVVRVVSDGVRFGQSAINLPGAGNTTVGVGTTGGQFSASMTDGFSIIGNRQGTDGPVVSIRKGGVVRGSIGVDAGHMTFFGGTTEVYRVTDDAVRGGQSTVDLPGSGNTTTGFGFKTIGEGAFSASGAIGLTVNRNASNGIIVSFRRAGVSAGSVDATSGTTVVYTTSSDYRLKYDAPPPSDYDPIATVEALAAAQRWYGWKTDAEAPRELGWFAHELQEIEPRAVTGVKDAVDENGEMIIQGRADTQLIVHLVAAVAALSKRVKELELAQ